MSGDEQTHELTGQKLSQDKIGRMPGEGGRATVYLAEQMSIRRTEAGKVLPAN